ncbi:hypothetical protein CEXT_71431, partial [Caerostris extrusa]
MEGQVFSKFLLESRFSDVSHESIENVAGMVVPLDFCMVIYI